MLQRGKIKHNFHIIQNILIFLYTNSIHFIPKIKYYFNYSFKWPTDYIAELICKIQGCKTFLFWNVSSTFIDSVEELTLCQKIKYN